MRIVFERDDYRVVEIPDEYASLEDLEGDSYNPAVNDDIPLERLLAEKRAFRDLVEREGVYGYVLERWNPTAGVGWTHVDSCWGFVGRYTPGDPTFNHFIVYELVAQIPGEEAVDA